MSDFKTFFFQYSEPLTQQTFELLLCHTDQIQRKKILSFRNEADIQRSLLGFVLSRYIGIKYFKCPGDLRMAVGEYGKPFYISQDSYHFNISHSGEWVICAAGPSPIGCDVQLHKPVNLDVAKRFYHPKEYRILSELPQSQQEDFFFTLWVLKESYIKALGKGFTHGMKSYYFDVQDSDNIILSTDNMTNPKWKFVLHDLDPDHKCAVCMNRSSGEMEKINVDLENLLNFFS